MVARTECPRGVFETSSISSASMVDAGNGQPEIAPCEDCLAMLQPVDDERPGRYRRRLFGCSRHRSSARLSVSLKRSRTADMENLLRRP
jgi:hypothetical protein